MRCDRNPAGSVRLEDLVHGRTGGSNRPLTRGDVLQVAISLAKSGGSHRDAVDFVSDVALTFEVLSGEIRQGSGSRGERLLMTPRPDLDD